ncbi:hypothetical protein H920_15579 [Fukomys damarensis]|uniref:Uncharacterized protein n=1 Tax=Fukomys damarensis TaxID=885580 RepID=A0A091CWJ2_FUKDA|nr:hypothetical protein H920_15579 [Fukomys damarensis]
MSCTSPAEGLEPKAISHATLYQGSATGRPKGQWWNRESLCQGVKDPHWSQEVTHKVQARAPLMRTAAIPEEGEDLSSAEDKNCHVCVRKTSLPGKFNSTEPSGSLLVPLETILRWVFHSQNHTDSVQLGVLT